MTESKHTPGPWRTSKCVWVERDMPGTQTVARCHDPSRAEADARLIASAPDLLEALEEIVMLEEGTHPAPYDDVPIGKCIADLARAAIAKAKGGE